MIRPTHLDDRSKVYPLVEIQGVKLRIPHPEEIPQVDFVEREDILEQALAAWMTVDGLPPLNFRFYGPPGVGKNALVYQLAKLLNKDLYILNGNEELDPEDIACSARFTSADTVEYVASPLFAAMLNGGIFFFDEIGKAPPAALNPLASVLDERRTLSSVLAGIHLHAHPEFLCCAALNEDEESGGRLPQFIVERFSPAIYVGIPPLAILKQILQGHLAMADERWVELYLKEFLKKDVSPREAIIHLQFAYSRARRAGKSQVTAPQIREFLGKANCTGHKTEPATTGKETPDTFAELPIPQEKPNDWKSVLPFQGRRRSKAIH